MINKQVPEERVRDCFSCWITTVQTLFQWTHISLIFSSSILPYDFRQRWHAFKYRTGYKRFPQICRCIFSINLRVWQWWSLINIYSLCILDAYKREGQVNSLLRKPLCLSCLCHSQSHSAEDRQAGTDQTWKRREMKKKNCCNIRPIQGLWKRLTYDFFDSKMSTKYCNHSTFVLGKLRRDVEGIQHQKSLGEVQN